jgi:hypothetical protein
MIGSLLPLMLAASLSDSAPAVVTITGVNGETRIPIRADVSGAPVIAAPRLMLALNASETVTDGWAEVSIGPRSFRFLLGAPLYVFDDHLRPLAAPASMSRDTLFLPFQFISEILPSALGDRYRYDRRRARLIDAGTGARAPVARTPSETREVGRLPNGLRPGHMEWIPATRASFSLEERGRRKSLWP